MLETQTLTTAVKIDLNELPSALLKLSENGWTPALFDAQRTFLKLAGVSEKLLTIPTQRSYRSPASSTILGDIFFRDEDMYYLVTNIPGDSTIDRYGRVVFYRDDEAGQPILEVGIITNKATELEERLRVFVSAVENALKSSIDGRKARHMNFDWSELKPRTPQIENFLKTEGEQSGLKLNKACIVPEELDAAKVLASKLARDTLIELSQAGFVRERDFLSRKAKNQDDIKKSLQTLRSVDLLNSEFLLECRRTGAPLTRLKDSQKIKNPEISGLACPSCGTSFDQELLSEGYSLSSLGRKMSQQSYWMTVWVTNLLANLGVPQNSILWNISESGDEVDLLVGFLGQLWIFELKDREFGAGDAYPLNYRQVRYKATKAIIITTEKISRDAKKVFEEVIRESRRPERSGPVYIEGLEAAEIILRKEVSEAALRYARQRLVMLGELSGYDLGKVVTVRFGGNLEPQAQEYIDADPDLIF